MKKRIFIEALSVVTPWGKGLDGLLTQLLNPRETPTRLQPAVGPLTHGFKLSLPQLDRMGINRKSLRMMERQAAAAIWAAIELQRDEHFELRAPEDTGLFFAIPSIAHAVDSCLDLKIETSISAREITASILRNTEPLSGLRLLNSSVLAHLAEHFHLSGAVGGFSDHADAGLQALIEGSLAIFENDSIQVLAGGVSPVAGPGLAPVWESAEMFNREPLLVPAESAAVALLSDVEKPRSLFIAGYGRCFNEDPSDAAPEAIKQALEQAGIAFDDLDLLALEHPSVVGGSQADMRRALAQLGSRSSETLPLLTIDHLVGHFGAASPWVKIALIQDACRRGMCLFTDSSDCVREASRQIHYALVSAQGFSGQCAVVILGWNQ